MNYVEPEVTDHGDLVDLTAGQASGPATDADFPAGTPQNEITFS